MCADLTILAGLPTQLTVLAAKAERTVTTVGIHSVLTRPTVDAWRTLTFIYVCRNKHQKILVSDQIHLKPCLNQNTNRLLALSLLCSQET